MDTKKRTRKEEQFGDTSKLKHGWILTLIFSVLAVIFVSPIFIVLMNSFKQKSFINLQPFSLPKGETFVKFENYTRGLEQTGFFDAFKNSLIITVLSVALIILCTSMCAWYIARVNSKGTNFLYTLCLSVFMFVGFVKSIPLEIEEAAMIDGCNPLQTYFQVVFPILKPTCITVAILQAMWVWNDYLLPYLVLDITEYKTIPIAIQYLKGGYGSVDWGAMMAMLVLAIIPIVIFYMACQKHIIKGVIAGAVKG